MLELLPSFEPHRGGTPVARTSEASQTKVGRQLVSEDHRHSTDATNHPAATPRINQAVTGHAHCARIRTELIGDCVVGGATTEVIGA
jgi:hypothetical protein